MPNYVYECRTEGCKLNGETVDQPFAPMDAPAPTCPNCGEPMAKTIQPVGIAFKGSGFYSTDNRQK